MTNKNLDREGGEKCNDCDGDGFHVVEVLTASGVQENGGPCPTCDGTGKRQPQAGAAMPSDDLRTFLLGHITATELHGTKFERLELAHNDVWVLRQMLEAPTATATKQTDTGAVGAGEVKTWQERVDGDFLAYWKRRGYNPAEGAMMAEIADLRAQLARQRQELDALAKAIAQAAEQRGIVKAGTALTGAQLVMLCADLATPPAAQAVPGDEVRDAALVRYCPGCGTIGDVDTAKHRDCCPDGRMAFRVPKKFAEQCRGTFQIAINSAGTPGADVLEAIADAVEEYQGDAENSARIIRSFIATLALRATNTKGEE